MAKTAEELQLDAKQYFEQYEDDVLFATNDGMFFLPANRGDGAAHARTIGSELFTISRGEDEASENPDAGSDVVPNIKMKKDTIVAWMTEKQIEFDPAATKEVLLTKVTEFLTPKE